MWIGKEQKKPCLVILRLHVYSHWCQRLGLCYSEAFFQRVERKIIRDHSSKHVFANPRFLHENYSDTRCDACYCSWQLHLYFFLMHFLSQSCNISWSLCIAHQKMYQSELEWSIQIKSRRVVNLRLKVLGTHFEEICNAFKVYIWSVQAFPEMNS